ncbi:magnesium protoporphyrin IX methyltransferase [Tabrizicola sp.]|uniref:magnesium protoporphyrin IX methyltransferase n=1 Tax=Tabrizicola sp. TaxID=2005166 RepID=UPI00260AB65E|nr:magnesium protoporphyrin IX methyltransferase [Tabrizicola sp.]MDM7930566.1 magnesium protoporphyrin IX methyltransferase [Tabrizicola sp.]
MPNYVTTRDRVETYFDRTATKAWERLTSDAPVSRIRQTVREGRDRMRALMLSRLPEDLRGARVLDAGCGTGAMTEELALRGASVMAADISPKLVEIARDRLPATLRPQVSFHAGDMTDPALGRFDFVLAMDSLIYYGADDIARTLHALGKRSGAVVFTVAPRTTLLMAMWHAGKLFPRSDRSPVMIPHSLKELGRATGPGLSRIGRVSRGFYISDCMEFQP